MKSKIYLHLASQHTIEPVIKLDHFHNSSDLRDTLLKRFLEKGDVSVETTEEDQYYGPKMFSLTAIGGGQDSVNGSYSNYELHPVGHLTLFKATKRENFPVEGKEELTVKFIKPNEIKDYLENGYEVIQNGFRCIIDNTLLF